MPTKQFITASVLSALLSFCVVGCSTTTDTGSIGIKRQQLLLVSSQEINRMAEKAYHQTIRNAKSAGKLDVNPAQVARLKRIANRLIPHTSIYRTDATNWNWQVHAISSNDLNAYVMPSGKIIFYTGIINRLSLSDDEIAAIMGHEMAHALREHSREQLSRQLATYGGISLAANMFGLSSGQVQIANLVNEFGLSLPHSRTQEREADQIGLELMARAGYNPNAAISLWQKMQAADGAGTPEFLSTHPHSQNRIANLQSLMPTVLPLYQTHKGKR